MYMHKGEWDVNWDQFVRDYSEYAGHENSKDVVLWPTWLLSLFLRTIRDPARWALRWNSPLTRTRADYARVALVLLTPMLGIRALAERQPAGDVCWAAPVRGVPHNAPR